MFEMGLTDWEGKIAFENSFEFQVEYTTHKGRKATYDSPEEPASIDINKINLIEAYDANGNVMALTDDLKKRFEDGLLEHYESDIIESNCRTM